MCSEATKGIVKQIYSVSHVFQTNFFLDCVVVPFKRFPKVYFFYFLFTTKKAIGSKLHGRIDFYKYFQSGK